MAVLAAFTGVALAAEEPAVPPASDGPAMKGTAQAIPESNVYDLLTKSETTLSAIYYGRDRQDQTPGSNNGDIHVNALNLGLNFKSGYAWDHLGFDAAAHAALRLNNGLGWSEVLYHDVNDKSDPSEEGRGKDKSTAVLSQAALKFRQNADGQGLSARLGYTPISIGTMGTSGGLQSHAYRGFEGKYKFGDFEVGYGWADQFRNEWDNQFRDMTNKWHQNRAPYNDGSKIDYVHSLGLRYAPKNWFVDVGFGEGKDYRSNYQIAASYTWQLGADSLTATGYYIGAKYKANGLYSLDGKKPIADPKREWHASGSLSYTTGGLTLMGGYGTTHSPDSGEMNFRLTSWANSDNRNFIQTWGQLDDFVWDGTKVFKVGLSYDFGKVGVAGLSAGISANFASGMKNGPNKADTKAEEIDFNVGYTVQSGFLKGASIGVYPAQLRTHGFSGKADRNDVKVIASYSKTF
ncbi:hypothetical protein BUE93_00850 [Chromobacterium amazonense]|uniref:Porin n=1 Tax=Chromobacterium amazonense TaxID=1382803 RepID=A0A2S9XA55_9NEIS|nr:hypothetical protein BUE93_00850 [Chromobacterium amazonense]